MIYMKIKKIMFLLLKTTFQSIYIKTCFSSNQMELLMDLTNYEHKEQEEKLDKCKEKNEFDHQSSNNPRKRIKYWSDR